MKLFQRIKRNPFQAILVLMVPAIVFFALIAPWLFTTFSSPIIFNEDTGHIGNTFGIMSPFIAIAAVIVTYLAFRMQLDANEKMFDNSRRMQFERQFYEMLKIHCDNVKSLHAESSYTPPGSDYPVRKADKHLFSYADKRLFLRILRAQLSSAEQTLLYYNWKSKRGKQWEEDSTKPGCNHFFTDYRMIHNIIPKDCWAFSSDEILQSLLEKNPHYEKLNDEDTLFELIDEKGA